MAGFAEKIGELIGSGVGSLVKDVGETVDTFVHTGDEKAEWELKKKELELSAKRMAIEVQELYLSDRQSARQMYMKDSGLQKAFAIIFLAGYLAITGLMIWLVVGWLGGGGLDLPTWAVSLVSMVFTAMSTKVNTIVDFLFGGSQGERDNAGAISRSFQDGAGGS